ncbi:MAG: HAMP domain-containing histidine kinase [Oscillatoriales cyanobacterium SM2_1_8]|nr:HAMP domain-containing histidine kinase [Oscillatoriales cyanobacterium SM2_1_8]
MAPPIGRAEGAFRAARLRLALWYALITALLLVLFATGFYGYVRLTLVDRIDDTIAHVAEVLERSIRNDRQAWQRGLGQNDSLEADRIEVEWFDGEGHPVFSTLPTLSREPLHLGYFTAHPPNGEPLRQLTQAVQIGRETLGYLRVSHPWFEVTKPAAELVVDLAIGSTLALTVVALCGWGFAALAIAPMRESYERLQQFAADASHELRNPMAILQANAQAALFAPEGLPPRQQQHLEAIERLSRRLSRILEDLLLLARTDSQVGPPTQQPCDLSAIAQDVAAEYEPMAQAQNLALGLEAPSPALVLGDRDSLARLLGNLLSNAITYTPSGGRVQLVVNREGPYHQATVIDTGIGIATGDLPHIFDRFWRKSADRQRLGLGLAIAKAIAESHGGRLTIASTLGQGTRATLRLPVCKPSPLTPPVELGL